MYVSADARFLKLIIHDFHANTHNIYNQVSIIAVSVVGSLLPEGGRMDMVSQPPGMPPPSVQYCWLGCWLAKCVALL